MYPILLALHSLIRWFVLVSLFYSLYLAYRGLLGNKPFTGHDNFIRHTTATIAHIQLIFGIWLYFISPVINYFLHNYQDAIHIRQIRFFGMEHSVMMLVSIILITIGAAITKRKATDKQKFKTIAIWYSMALLIILINIPWPFSIFASRPYFRAF